MSPDRNWNIFQWKGEESMKLSSVRPSVCPPVCQSFHHSDGFAAVGPAGLRYWSTAAIAGRSAAGFARQQNASSVTLSADVCSWTQTCFISKILGRVTNYELLRWLVEMPSRDVYHYRMINASRSTVCHYTDKRTWPFIIIMTHGHVTFTKCKHEIYSTL